jgi:hypothetical protein
MRCRSHPTRASHLRQPAQGNVIRVCGARANCGPGINTRSGKVAACPASCPHRISRTHYRPSMFNRVRGRAWRAGLMRRRPRDPGEPLLSRRQLTLGFFQGFSVLVAVIAVRHSALPRPARNNGACAHVCHACDRQSHAHPGKPVLEPYHRRNPSWTQSRAVVGGWRHDCGACAVDLCPVFAFTVSIFGA